MKPRAIVAMICLLGLSVLLSGCLCTTVVVTDLDDGAARVLATGDRLTIELAGNPTTGYAWVRIEPSDLGDGPLAAIEEGTCTAPDQCSLVGEGGDYLFEYQAVSSGTVTLRYAYKRPWEDEPIDEFAITIWVR